MKKLLEKVSFATLSIFASLMIIMLNFILIGSMTSMHNEKKVAADVKTETVSEDFTDTAVVEETPHKTVTVLESGEIRMLKVADENSEVLTTLKYEDHELSDESGVVYTSDCKGVEYFGYAEPNKIIWIDTNDRMWLKSIN